MKKTSDIDWRGARGTTVLEQIVVVLILSSALIMAARLMIESQRRAVLEQNRLSNPALRLALQQLKADVLSASNWRGDPDPENEDPAPDPLILTGPSGLITYLLVGRDLWRVTGENEEEQRRLLLPGVSYLNWQDFVEWTNPPSEDPPPVVLPSEDPPPVELFPWKPPLVTRKQLLKIDLEYEVGLTTGAEMVNGIRIGKPRGLEQRTLVLALRGDINGAGW